MVGALSIVRFRTAIKDPRDTAYIFWCIAAGICCGSEDYLVASLGSGVIFFAMLFLGNVINNNRYLLIVRGAGENFSLEVANAVTKYYNRHAFFRVCNETKASVELIYEVSDHNIKHYKKAHNGTDIQTTLFKIEGVDTVNLICQNDEITR
ncbi:MAG: DUF4956 domain-containing protein, partial [Treponema sp.]|nr:DUF4956 domain-containing protein [Treponema sp.]